VVSSVAQIGMLRCCGYPSFLFHFLQAEVIGIADDGEQGFFWPL